MLPPGGAPVIVSVVRSSDESVGSSVSNLGVLVASSYDVASAKLVTVVLTPFAFSVVVVTSVLTLVVAG